jgi:DNA mismatch repair protein MutS
VTHQVTFIDGDGIGPEIAAITRKCVEATGVDVEWDIQQAGTDKSYGIHVAKLAGVPKQIIERSKRILAQLEASNLDDQDRPRVAPLKVKAKKPHEMQLTLFRSPHEPTIDALRKLNTETLSPLEALMKLKSLREEIRRREEGEG